MANRVKEGDAYLVVPDEMYNGSITANSQLICQVVNYIDRNLCNIREFAQIADEVGYSYSHLSHIFTRETGKTIQEYFNQKRFEKAINWLKKGEMNITQISERLRYQSIHSFSKAFHKFMGISPSEYITLFKEKQKMNN